MKIGWLHDDFGMVGGSELSERTLRAGAPEWAEIVTCPPQLRPPDDIEAFIIQNCATYPRKWREVFEGKPIVKHCRDSWWAGSITLRRWILDHAALLLFSSRMQEETYEHAHDSAKVAIVPPPVNLDWFKDAALPEDQRQDAIWVGRADPGKGLHLSCDWAWRTATPLDIYGDMNIKYLDVREFGGLVTYHGKVPYEVLPGIYGRARIFHFTPVHIEPFARTVVEAWAAGCELIVEGRVGALEWIAERPDDIGRGVEMFWQEVESVLQ